MRDPESDRIFDLVGTDTTLWVSTYQIRGTKTTFKVSVIPLFPTESGSRLPTNEELGKGHIQGERLFEPYKLEHRPAILTPLSEDEDFSFRCAWADHRKNEVEFVQSAEHLSEEEKEVAIREIRLAMPALKRGA